MSESQCRIVAAFDFDGTLFRGDSFITFAKFACGTKGFIKAVLKSSPSLLLCKLGLMPSSKAKQRLFSALYRGLSYERFRQLGEQFSAVINTRLREDTYSAFLSHIESGHAVYIISASLKEWIEPWALKQGAKGVIATEPQVDCNGMMTGHFASGNCRDDEKPIRLLAIEPDRSSYVLHAYGDSPKADGPLLALADYAHLVKDRP